jgi:dienelactone hydrolase
MGPETRSLLPFLLMAVSISVFQTHGNPTIDLPNPTGPSAVGGESFHWTDVSRGEDMTEGKDGLRELMVHIWYPAEPTSGTSVAPYVPNLELGKARLDASQYNVLRLVRTHTLVNARLSLSQSRYPVIIFSHGNGMNGFLYTAITEDLASHGYVVAAVDHPYEAIFTVFPDGRVASYSEERQPDPNSPSFQESFRERVNNRAADIVFVLTQLTGINARKDSRFSGRLDLTHVGAFGHSIGGTAAAQACEVDERLRACANLDGRAAAGPFYPNSKGNGPEQPFMYLAKPLRELSDEELAKEKMTREQFEQGRVVTVNRENKLMQSVRSGSYRIIIKGATHESFSDELLLLSNASREAQAENQRRTQIVRDYVLAFFDKYLETNKGTLLDSTSQRYPEVTIERFGPALK